MDVQACLMLLSAKLSVPARSVDSENTVGILTVTI